MAGSCGSSVKAKEDSTTTVTTTESTASDTGSQDSAKTTTTTTTKETTTIDVKGTSLQGFKGGMEESMVNFLNSGKYATTDDEALKLHGITSTMLIL